MGVGFNLASQEDDVIDPRQPRLGQGITGSLLLLGYVFQRAEVLPLLAAVLALASLGGPRLNPYAHLFRWARSRFLGPPRELEEPGPPRFANTLGFLFLTGASVAHYAAGATGLAWGLGLLVSALALLAAVTGLCVGCEVYVIVRRLTTRGRLPRRITAPPGQAAR